MKVWRIINRQNDANLFPYALHIRAMGEGFCNTFGQAYDNLVELKDDGKLTQAVIWKQYHHLGKRIMKRLLQDKKYAAKALKQTELFMAKWFNYSEKLIHQNFNNKSNRELAKYINKYSDFFYRTSSWGVLISIVEYEHELLTTAVKSLLDKKIRKYKLKITLEDLFQLVTTKFATTFIVKERDELLRIALQINKNFQWRKLFNQSFDKVIIALPRYRSLNILIQRHLQKYLWLSFSFEGPVMNKGSIIQSLQELIKKKPTEVKKALQQNRKKLRLRQYKYRQHLKCSQEESHILDVIRDFGFSKAYRKDVEYHGNYAYHILLEEIARRFPFTAHQAHYYTPKEIIEILRGTRDVDINLLNERIKHCIYIMRRGKPALLQGAEARNVQKNFFEHRPSVGSKELTGQCAMPGYARGTVKIILDQKDFHKFAAHNVLVSYSTSLSMVPLMKIARAVITDVGGITAHAAIVSRELGVPCVIGTKAATKNLRDGDMVEVDATKGVVKKL